MIEKTFSKLKKKGEGALIAYVCAGDPTPNETKDIVNALIKGGADMVEVGLPFSDPIADGPVIQGAIDRSLRSGMTPDLYFKIISDLDVKVPLLVMTYYNLIFKRGVKKFVSDCKKSNICGIIVPDLPIEESKELFSNCKKHGVDLIFFIAPTTTDPRIKNTLKQASGFLYLVSRLGVTGQRDDVSSSTGTLINRLSSVKVPKAVGFGISKKEHAEQVIKSGADGVIVGSAFVNIIAKKEGNFKEQLTQLAAELKEGCISGYRDR